MSAEQLTAADRAQYFRDAQIGIDEARRNAERARSEVLGLRRPSTRELAQMRGMSGA